MFIVASIKFRFVCRMSVYLELLSLAASLGVVFLLVTRPPHSPIFLVGAAGLSDRRDQGLPCGLMMSPGDFSIPGQNEEKKW